MKNLEKKIKAWMRLNVIDYVDHITGEVNCTALAEGAALDADNDSWLDDEIHPVWDWALDIAEAYEKIVC